MEKENWLDITISKNGKLKLGYCGLLYTILRNNPERKYTRAKLICDKFPLVLELSHTDIECGDTTDDFEISSIGFEGIDIKT